MDRTDGHFDDLFPETEIKFTVRDSMRDYGVSTLEAGKERAGSPDIENNRIYYIYVLCLIKACLQ